MVSKKTSTSSKIPENVTYKYHKAIAQVRERLGYDLVLDPFMGAEFCYHKIYKRVDPPYIKGIEFPEGFKYWRSLFREELAFLEEEVSDLMVDYSHDYASMANLSPIFFASAPKDDTVTLLKVVKRLIKLKPKSEPSRGIYIRTPDDDKVDYNIVPRAFLPDDDWFVGELRDLREEDILTILEAPEREVFTLSIGRAVCGVNGTTHLGTGRLIRHTWRTCPIVTGMPQIGKSTVTKSLLKALDEVGYHTSIFENMSARFGIADIVTADIAFADDLNQETFKKFIQSTIIKQAVVGSEIRTEQKGIDSVVTTPRALFLANINDFNVGCTYGTDDGVLDRLKILDSRMPTEFDSLIKTIGGVSAGSPSLHPVPHLEYLCERLNCSETALLLKFAKLCANKFIRSMEKNTLDLQINRVSSKLQIQLHKHYDKVIAMVFQLAFVLRRTESFDSRLPDFKPTLLGEAIKAGNYLINDKRAHFVREEIKKDWKEKRRPSYHAWNGIKLLDQISVDNAADAYQSMGHTFADKDIDKCIKTTYTCLRLNQGYNIPANTAQVISAWEGSKKQYRNLLQLATKIRNNLEEDILLDLQTGGLARTSHIRDLDYDRQSFADEMNNEKI